MSRSDDTLPYKVHSTPVRTGTSAGQVVGKRIFKRLLDLYYRKRGWDDQGIPAAQLEKRYSP